MQWRNIAFACFACGCILMLISDTAYRQCGHLDAVCIVHGLVTLLNLLAIVGLFQHILYAGNHSWSWGISVPYIAR